MNQTPWSSSRHNTSYHRFFEGYLEKQIEVDTGHGKKKKIVRIYAADYYILDMSDNKYTAFKILIAVLYAAAVLSLILLYRSADPALLTKFAGAPQFSSVICVAALFIPIFNCLVSKRKMTVGEYRSGFYQLSRYTLIGAIMIWSNLLTILIYCIMQKMVPTGDRWFTLLIVLSGGAALMAISLIRKKVGVKTIENNAALEDGVEIR